MRFHSTLRAKGAVFLALSAMALCVACSPTPHVNLELDSEVLSLAANTKKLPVGIEDQTSQDAIAAYYKNSGTKQNVVDFFSALTNSTDVAVAILDNAVKHEVPASLAFAIAYEESRFDPKAKNRNATTTDGGLFQLNSSTFPHLTEKELFDPARNAREGLNYFKHILDLSGNEVSALAMYNAGRTRVSQKGAPVTTLDYISRILMYQKNINSLFTAKVVAKMSMLSKIRLGMIAQGADR